MWNIILRGILIGLITGMPTGPIGALCLKITITNGPVYGFISGLGSAIADSTYAYAAALGIRVIAKFMVKNQTYFRLFGGLILIVFGIHTILSKQTKTESVEKHIDTKTLFRSFISTFVLAIANPATIFSFIVVFTGSGLGHVGQTASDRFFLVLGVFIGSGLWWIILVLTAGKIRHKIDTRRMNLISKSLGVVIIVFGGFMLLSIANYSRFIRPPVIHSKLFEILLHIKSKVPHLK